MNPKPDQNKMKYIQIKQENTTKTAASLNLSVKKLKIQVKICELLKIKTKKPKNDGLKFQSPYPHINFHQFEIYFH